MTNKFVFVMPAFNAENTIDQTFKTITAQSYDNWRIIVRDDISTDKTRDKLKSWKSVLGERLQFETNDVKKWEVQNIVEMFKEVDDDEIICRIDADDWLVDNDALVFIDHFYKTQEVLGEKIQALWTAHRWSFSTHNISAPMNVSANPYTHPWVSSHLKTFRKFLLNDISDENFRGKDGQYFKRIGDQAVYLPVLHRAQGRWHFLPLVTYHYTIDMTPATFQTEDAKFQKEEAEFLRLRGFIE